MAAQLLARKRNISKERDISPINFNVTARSSIRQDANLEVQSLNTTNRQRMTEMMLKNTSKG